MREILFRGKSKHTNEFIYGLYFQKYEDGCIIHCIAKEPISANDYSEIIGDYEEIIPETLGQFSGLIDINSKKIFEGDIVLTQKYRDKPYSKNSKSKRFVGVVKYKIYGGSGFYNKLTKKHDRYLDYKAEWVVDVPDYGNFGHGAWGDFWDCEVIGNIHCNHELLDKNKGVM